MPKGYVIMTEAIRDQAGMEAYSKASTPSMVEAGARVRAVDPAPQVLEGEWHGDRTVVVEFESVEAARAWYESAGYQEAKPLRQAAADTNAVIVSGFEMPARPAGPEGTR
ncbi:DUF1330 domain-containing protein [Streptomyces sp. NPDC006356]